MGGTPLPPLTENHPAQKPLAEKGGTPALPLNGKNPLSSFWQVPLLFSYFSSTMRNGILTAWLNLLTKRWKVCLQTKGFSCYPSHQLTKKLNIAFAIYKFYLKWSIINFILTKYEWVTVWTIGFLLLSSGEEQKKQEVRIMLGSKRMTHPFCYRLAHPDNPNNLQKQFVGHLLQEAYPCKLSGSFANKLSYTDGSLCNRRREPILIIWILLLSKPAPYTWYYLAGMVVVRSGSSLSY